MGWRFATEPSWTLWHPRGSRQGHPRGGREEETQPHPQGKSGQQQKPEGGEGRQHHPKGEGNFLSSSFWAEVRSPWSLRSHPSFDGAFLCFLWVARPFLFFLTWNEKHTFTWLKLGSVDVVAPPPFLVVLPCFPSFGRATLPSSQLGGAVLLLLVVLLLPRSLWVVLFLLSFTFWWCRFPPSSSWVVVLSLLLPLGAAALRPLRWGGAAVSLCFSLLKAKK